MFRTYRLNSMMFAALNLAPDEGGKGGGGGGGGDDDKKAMTKEEITKLIDSTVTGAMTNWAGRITKNLESKLSTIGDDLLKKLSEKKDDDADPSKSKDPPDGDSELSRQLARMKTEREGDLKRIQRLEEGIKQKDTALEERTFRSELLEALNAAGVKKELLPAALALHRSSGQFKIKEGIVVGTIKLSGGVEDEVPAVKAIKAWIDTDEGKQFLPAVDTGGTGDGSNPKSGHPIQQGDDAFGLGAKDASTRTTAALDILATPPGAS